MAGGQRAFDRDGAAMTAARRRAEPLDLDDVLFLLHELDGSRVDLARGLSAVGELLGAARVHLRVETDEEVDELVHGGEPILEDGAPVDAEIERMQVALSASAGVRFVLTRGFPVGPDARAMLAISRDATHGQFTLEDRVALRRMLPHLAAAWRSARRARPMRSGTVPRYDG